MSMSWLNVALFHFPTELILVSFIGYSENKLPPFHFLIMNRRFGLAVNRLLLIIKFHFFFHLVHFQWRLLHFHHILCVKKIFPLFVWFYIGFCHFCTTLKLVLYFHLPSRKGLLSVAVVTTLTAFLSAFSPNYTSLLVLRMLVGTGLAGGPVYSSWFLEFVPPQNRGLWMVIFSTFWTVGTVLESLLAWVWPLCIWQYASMIFVLLQQHLNSSEHPCFLVKIFRLKKICGVAWVWVCAFNCLILLLSN